VSPLANQALRRAPDEHTLEAFKDEHTVSGSLRTSPDSGAARRLKQEDRENAEIFKQPPSTSRPGRARNSPDNLIPNGALRRSKPPAEHLPTSLVGRKSLLDSPRRLTQEGLKDPETTEELPEAKKAEISAADSEVINKGTVRRGKDFFEQLQSESGSGTPPISTSAITSLSKASAERHLTPSRKAIREGTVREGMGNFEGGKRAEEKAEHVGLQTLMHAFAKASSSAPQASNSRESSSARAVEGSKPLDSPAIATGTEKAYVDFNKPVTELFTTEKTFSREISRSVAYLTTLQSIAPHPLRQEMLDSLSELQPHIQQLAHKFEEIANSNGMPQSKIAALTEVFESKLYQTYATAAIQAGVIYGEYKAVHKKDVGLGDPRFSATQNAALFPMVPDKFTGVLKQEDIAIGAVFQRLMRHPMTCGEIVGRAAKLLGGKEASEVANGTKLVASAGKYAIEFNKTVDIRARFMEGFGGPEQNNLPAAEKIYRIDQALASKLQLNQANNLSDQEKIVLRGSLDKLLAQPGIKSSDKSKIKKLMVNLKKGKPVDLPSVTKYLLTNQYLHLNTNYVVSEMEKVNSFTQQATSSLFFREDTKLRYHQEAVQLKYAANFAAAHASFSQKYK